MSKIEELIKEKCPNGAKKYTIKNICDVTRGRVISKMELKENEGDYPVYSSQTLNNGVFGKINTYDFDGEYVQWTTDGANAGSIFYRNGKFSVTNVCGLLKVKPEYQNKINTNYLSYALTMESKKYVNYATSNPKLMSNTVERITILIPPIEIQEEIVKILNQFSKLEAELEARKSQYEFWRSELFKKSQNKMVILESIGDVTKLAGFEFSEYVNYSNEGSIIALRGLNVKNGHLVLDNVKYVDNSDFSKLNRSKLYENDILYTYVGTVGQVGLVDKNDKYYLAPNVARIRINDKNVNPKYVMHFLLSKEFKNNQLDTLSGTSSMKNITMMNIRKFKIPVPPIEVQNNVVSILDKFDKLVNDITIGIPAEIEARRKQYEYYRNKLLSFKEVSCE